jgi:hypothetical protein
VVVYNGGHFVLEEYAPEVAREIIEMFSRSAKQRRASLGGSAVRSSAMLSG